MLRGVLNNPPYIVSRIDDTFFTKSLEVNIKALSECLEILLYIPPFNTWSSPCVNFV